MPSWSKPNFLYPSIVYLNIVVVFIGSDQRGQTVPAVTGPALCSFHFGEQCGPKPVQRLAMSQRFPHVFGYTHRERPLTQKQVHHPGDPDECLWAKIQSTSSTI